MRQLTVEMKEFIVETHRACEDLKEVEKAFQVKFPERKVPNKETMYRYIRKFKATGSFSNGHTCKSGRKRTVRCEENIEAVLTILQNYPERFSSRKNHIGMSSSSFNRITRLDLRWHPYKIQPRVPLTGKMCKARSDFCNWFVDYWDRDDSFSKHLVVGDLAEFSLNGFVSSRNIFEYVHRIPPKPEQPTNPQDKVFVWSGVCGNGFILGPYFFSQAPDETMYAQMFSDLTPKLTEKYKENFDKLWWVQDGEPTVILNQILNQSFHNHVIGRGRDIQWPSCSPDLTPCEYFLWGYLKHKVYRNSIESLPDLCDRITEEIETITRDQKDFVVEAMEHMKARAVKCVEKDGENVEGLI